MDGVRVALYGSGRTATELVAGLALSRHDLVASVVHSPSRAGHDIGSLTTGETVGVLTTSDLDGTLRSGDVDVLLYAGLSGEVHARAIELCAEVGVDMVHASFVHPRVALDPASFARYNALAARTGSRIVGTGMIPGLWLDVLPSLLATGLPAPVSVVGARVSDISSWGREVLAQELGVGTTRTGPAETPELMLRESAQMIADALDLDGLALQSRGGLVHATEAKNVGGIDVRPGEVEGFRQEVLAVQRSGERIRLAWSGLVRGAGEDCGHGMGVRLVLTGADGSEIKVDVDPPVDPYPGTAARMLAAVSGLAGLPGGLHPTVSLANS
jgi:hypothetical protein